MKRIILFVLMLFNFLYSANVEELHWQKGETFLTFLEKQSIPVRLYYSLDSEDKELCSEIQTNSRFFLYTNDDGSFNQALIPISQEIQIHIFKDIDDSYKFQTIPINYTETTQTVAIQIKESVSHEILVATGDTTIAAILNLLFRGPGIDFKKMKKGDFIALKYTQRSYMGKQLGMPVILAAMVEINGKPFYRFRSTKDDKYYDEKGVGYTKTFLFQFPITYTRISSPFTNKRWHPILKRYRAHLGTDFAAPTGRNIYASSEGVVEFIGTRGGYGKTIILNHGNGYKTLYAHQSKFAKNIKRGTRVKKAQHIGYVGSTGVSSGPHLHFGVYRNGTAIDPMKVLKNPTVEGLKGNAKTTFIANSKLIIKQFEDEIKNENRNIPIKLDRIFDRSEINVL